MSDRQPDAPKVAVANVPFHPKQYVELRKKFYKAYNPITPKSPHGDVIYNAGIRAVMAEICKYVEDKQTLSELMVRDKAKVGGGL